MLQVLNKSMINLKVNGDTVCVAARPADTLLSILRGELGLTGAKNACGNGDCNACTVLMDGWPVSSCLVLAVEAIGHDIMTIEGLNAAPIQNAFAEKFAIQCGYCTPGMILNSHALINIHPDAKEDVINEWLESNICRCTGYHEIKEAIKSVLNS